MEIYVTHIIYVQYGNLLHLLLYFSIDFVYKKAFHCELGRLDNYILRKQYIVQKHIDISICNIISAIVEVVNVIIGVITLVFYIVDRTKRK